MADEKTPESETESKEEPKKPSWWVDAHDLSWKRVKAALLDDWSFITKNAGDLEKGLSEQAISFGHAARKFYDKLGVWSADVDARLREDWQRTNKDAKAAWDKVRDAVKHGWEKTSK